jgi:hypothetical protein
VLEDAERLRADHLHVCVVDGDGVDFVRRWRPRSPSPDSGR